MCFMVSPVYPRHEYVRETDPTEFILFIYLLRWGWGGGEGGGFVLCMFVINLNVGQILNKCLPNCTIIGSQ